MKGVLIPSLFVSTECARKAEGPRYPIFSFRMDFKVGKCKDHHYNFMVLNTRYLILVTKLVLRDRMPFCEYQNEMMIIRSIEPFESWDDGRQVKVEINLRKGYAVFLNFVD